jgi:hypothetical protein
MTRYIVTGHYCPTANNPEKEAYPTTIELGCRTLAEVRDAKLHMVGAKVKKVA